MVVWAALLLLASRVFHPVAIDALPTARYTHVAVVGRVTLVRPEADGDVHFRIADAHGDFAVCEIVPYHRLVPPRVGQWVRVEGIRRYDDAPNHGWWEVHPVERWRAAQ